MTDPVFFEPSRRYSAAEVAKLTGARLVDEGHAGVEIAGIASLEAGGEGMLVYAEGRRNARLAEQVRAAAILCTADLADRIPARTAVLVASRPQAAFARIGRLLYPAAASPAPLTAETGISPHAHVDPTARLEEGVTVEAGAVIGPLAAIGTGTVIAPNAVVGRLCRIGRNCHVGPGASLQYTLMGDRVVVHSGARIGKDGFGFVAGPRGPERVPQIGRVVIQDDVEIGSNTTIDRGAMADTIIGEGTKIDNLVQVAHNVRIGRGCIIAGHCGISGSVRIGDHAMLGGGVGIADHIEIGDRAQVGARSGVMNDIPANERWVGAPAMPTRDFFRQVAAVQALAKSRKGARE